MQVGHLSYTKPRHCSSRQFSLVCAQFSLEWCRYSAVCYGWTRIENAAYGDWRAPEVQWLKCPSRPCVHPSVCHRLELHRNC